MDVVRLSRRRLLTMLLGAALMTAQGCSGLCSMVLHNDTDENATVAYRYVDPYDGDIRSDTFEVRPGESVGKSLWFQTAPPWLDIEATFGIWRVGQRIKKKEFPANVLAESSAPTSFHVHVTRKGVLVKGPTFWDRFGELTLLFCAVTAAPVVLLFVTKRFRWRDWRAS